MNATIIYDVPWWPHYGISFSINRRPEHIKTLQLAKPTKLPDSTTRDDNDRPTTWNIKPDEWDKLYDGAADLAKQVIEKSIASCTES